VDGLRITFSNARLWRYLMASVGKFIDTGYILVNENGLVFKAMDPSKTALVIFEIPKEGFMEFDVEGEHKLPLSIEDTAKILRTAGKDDILSVEWSSESITFVFERRGVPRSFTIPLYAESAVEEIPDLKELEIPNKYVIYASGLHDAISSIEDVSEVLAVSGDEQKLVLTAEGDIATAEITLDTERGGLEEAHVENPGFRALYSMEYFSYLKSLMKMADRTILEVEENMPCRLTLEYSVGARIVYYVAPRVEE
jgi:DNA polymerase III sliding clamp (beta) subunit (PCNA family)